MVKVIEVNILDEYSCQICQKFFVMPFSVKIIENEYPICSLRCFFRLTYRILSVYSIDDLLYLKKCLDIQNLDENDKQNRVYQLSKVYIRLNLSLIKEDCHLS